MRSKVNRKINRQPIRSPSPDIANKNIIKQTSSPIYDALTKSRKLNQSLQEHSQVEDMKIALNQWQQKYRKLQQQLNPLLIQNSDLKRQVHHLHNIIKRKEEELHQSQQNKRSPAQIRQYQNRFDMLMQQIHRIQALLHEEKSKSEILNREIDYLKQTSARNVKNEHSVYRQQNAQNKLDQIQKYLSNQMENKKKDIELKARLVMNQLQNRLSQMHEKQLDLQYQLRKRQFSTPKVIKETKMHESTTPGQTSTISPEGKRFGRKSIRQDDENKHLEEQLRNKVDQIVHLQSQNKSLQIQLIKQKQRNALNLEGECQQCKIYLKQIQQLQLEIQRLRKQISSTKEVDQNVKRRQDIQNLDSENSIEDYLLKIKEIKQYLNNEQIRELINKINQLMNDNSKLNTRVSNLLQEIERLSKQAKSKQLQQLLLINEINKDNQILKVQLKEQNDQIANLQQLLQQKYQYQEPEGQKAQNQLVEGQESRIFQHYIEEAIKKLENLEETMQTTLRE